jgi:ABC-type multidrug transport system fused ATPase/permease subunit
MSNNSNDRHCKELQLGEVKIIDGAFKWRSSQSEQPTLNNINIHIKPGELCCIYGPTGWYLSLLPYMHLHVCYIIVTVPQ